MYNNTLFSKNSKLIYFKCIILQIETIIIINSQNYKINIIIDYFILIEIYKRIKKYNFMHLYILYVEN